MEFPKIKGEVYQDDLTRALYATDASMYQILPQMVALPRDEADLKSICEYASRNKMPILPRGSATSLAGQTVNQGIVVDFTKYFNRILSYTPETATAVVQPGVTRDQMNELCVKDRLHFAPDPATSNRATFGGMIANNSSGTKSILYGKTSDYVKRLKIMLIDGTVLEFSEQNLDEVSASIALGGRKAEILQQLREIVFEHSHVINETYPKVMRRVTGYALDAFTQTDTWNLCDLITGSEGSLAFILEAEIGLVPLPTRQNLAVAHFTDRRKGIEAVKTIVGFGPAAVEVLDYNVLQQSKLNAITKKYHDNLIQGDPEIVLTVEFYGNSDEEIASKADQLTTFLKDYPTAYHCPVFTDMARINDALNLRKDGLGILMGKVAARKPQAFIEDSAIPLEHLAQYVEEVEAICNARGVDLVLYAHASVGVLHIRPYLDMTQESDIALMKDISNEVFKLVKSVGGSWSGEHGDGRNRGPRIREFYGDVIYEDFRKIKSAFDPEGLMNPNIILDTPPMDQHLRYGPAYRDQKESFYFKYRKDHSFEDLVHMCSGVGACRKTISGTMCPSFRATGEEKDTTRGRANALRLAMSGQYQFKDLAHPDIKEVMDLCLSCKACKTECPSNVDMAKLKSEVLQIQHDQRGVSLADRLVKYAPLAAKTLSGPWAPAVNFVQHSGVGKFFLDKLGNISPKRDLPSYASQSLVSWAGKNNVFKSDKKLVLFADTYINYHETELGKAAISLLNACGYQVILADVGCCQRPLISNGFLKEAKQNGTKTANKLDDLIKAGLPVLVLEPSCFSALSEDLPDLLDDEGIAQRMNAGISTVEAFLLKEQKAGNLKGKLKTTDKLLIHGHCHQKASKAMEDMQTLLKMNEIDYEVMDTGCCGMAGAFGYEKDHFDISKKVASDRLLPALEAADTSQLIACGTSCRHQIKDLSKKSADHLIAQLSYESE